MFRTLSCGVLMLGFIVLDDFPGLVSVSQPHKDAYFEDVRIARLGLLRPIGKRYPDPEGPF